MSGAKRTDAGAAVAGMFARSSATGGLAGRERAAAPEVDAASRAPRDRVPDAVVNRVVEDRLRIGVELPEGDVAWLRGLSRPARTGGPRSLGSKFVAAGMLLGAIELARTVDVDMHGVVAGDLAEMTARAKAALIRAAQHAEQPKSR